MAVGTMTKGRLEAFSDGVLAIIITIMVLEMKVPRGTHLSDLRPLLPVFLSYVMSYVYVGIYWNNHHHLLHTVQRIDGAVLWANLHLLFWLSMVPFATGWMGQNHFEPVPTALYGVPLVMAGFAWWLLKRSILRLEGPGSVLAKAMGKDAKGIWSVVITFSGVLVSLVVPLLGGALYALVALIWLVPDRRIERALKEE
ncbi:MAG TPA: TMEM175 family protein [Flavobacteriales bacterium]|nr:TMEM175 family protein [Flavobacteriales bacterium]